MKVCKTCGVKITEDQEVLFTYGKPGTRARLYARVCQFAKSKVNCINQDFDGKVGDRDEWESDPFS